MHLFFGKFMEIPPNSHRFLASKSPKKWGGLDIAWPMDRGGEAENPRHSCPVSSSISFSWPREARRPDMATICYDFIGSTLQKIQDISTYIRVPFKKHAIPFLCHYSCSSLDVSHFSTDVSHFCKEISTHCLIDITHPSHSSWTILLLQIQSKSSKPLRTQRWRDSTASPSVSIIWRCRVHHGRWQIPLGSSTFERFFGIIFMNNICICM